MSTQSPRTALVLSAGGAFGAYQAGAWSALAQEFQPDLFVGTSIGSVHAWLLAGGLPAEELHRIWLDPASSLPLKPRFPRSWRDGVFDNRPLEQRLRHLHELVSPQREVGIVAVSWKGLDSQLFQNQEITWEHLAASCAVPFVGRDPDYRDQLLETPFALVARLASGLDCGAEAEERRASCRAEWRGGGPD